MNPVSMRLLGQQLAAPQFTRPEDVVSYMGAMQAQEYRLMRWAVAMRTRKPSAQAFRKAYNDGLIIRQHLMRGTWQLIAGKDWHWMMDLCVPKAKSVITGWMKANHIDIPRNEMNAIRDILERTAGDKGSVTARDFEQALALKGITMDKHRLSYHIRFGELTGLLCSGNLDPKDATYSLASHKIGPSQPLEHDEALALLTRKYFLSRCPATLEDYVWWSGLSVGDCKRGIGILGSELRQEKWKGYEFYIHANARTRGASKDSNLLLPPFDEYLIGYKSREIVLPPEHRHRAHNNSGIFYPIIAHGGMICGNWKPFEKTLKTDFFDAGIISDLSDEWSSYRRYYTR